MIHGVYQEWSEPYMYRLDLEKQEECDVVAHERLTEPTFTIE